MYIRGDRRASALFAPPKLDANTTKCEIKAGKICGKEKRRN
jgi:hypothetical protein